MSEVLCVVEIAKGSRNKYEWDPERELFLLDRFLSAANVFPTDYGFIPGTETPDGDPLDVLIAVSEPTFTGCGILARPVGVLWLIDDGEREPKVVCVPGQDPNWESISDVDELPEQLREEIAHFFVSYKTRENHDVRADGWEDAAAAETVISQSRREQSAA